MKIDNLILGSFISGYRSSSCVHSWVGMSLIGAFTTDSCMSSYSAWYCELCMSLMQSAVSIQKLIGLFANCFRYNNTLHFTYTIKVAFRLNHAPFSTYQLECFPPRVQFENQIQSVPPRQSTVLLGSGLRLGFQFVGRAPPGEAFDRS